MARLNELLSVAQQYSRGLAAFLGLEEQEGVPTVAPELVPVTDIHSRPELWAMMGGSLQIGVASVNATGVGLHAQSALSPGEGELVVLEKIHLLFGVATEVLIVINPTELSTSTGNLVARDARRIAQAGGTAQSGTRIRTQNDIVFGGGGSTIWTRAAITTQEIILDLVLVRPWTVRVVAIPDNTNLPTHVYFCRSRPATPRELQIGGI